MTMRHAAAIALMALALLTTGACVPRDAATVDAARTTMEVVKAAQVEGVAFIDPTRALNEAAGLIPADAVLIVIVDVKLALDQALSQGFGMAPEGWNKGPMFNDLKNLSIKRFGVDLLQTEWLVFALTDKEEPMVILKGRFDAPERFEAIGATGLKGVKVDLDAFLIETGDPSFLALVKGEEGAATVAQVIGGQRGGLRARLAGSPMARVLAEVGAGALTIAAEPGDGPLSEELRRDFGLPVIPKAGAVAFSDDIVIVIEGDALSLRAIEAFVNQKLGEVQKEMSQELMEIDQRDPFEAGMTLIAYHYLMGVSKAVAPRIEGDKLRIEYRTIVDADRATALVGGLFFLGFGSPFLFFML